MTFACGKNISDITCLLSGSGNGKVAAHITFWGNVKGNVRFPYERPSCRHVDLVSA